MRVECIVMGDMGYNLISWMIRALMPSNSFESSFSSHKKIETVCQWNYMTVGQASLQHQQYYFESRDLQYSCASVTNFLHIHSIIRAVERQVIIIDN